MNTFEVGQPVIAFDDEEEKIPVMGYISKVFPTDEHNGAMYVISWSDDEEDLYPEDRVCFFVTTYDKYLKQSKV